jgi:F-type H+-transporting ATPase subunit delta
MNSSKFASLVRSDASLLEYLESPVIDTARRALGLKTIFTNRVTDLVLRFLLVLNANGRISRIETIQAAYDELVLEAWGRIEVDVWTATPLDSAGKEMLIARLHEILRKEPVLHTWVDPTLIGGIRIRIGDRLIDGSVAARLKQLEKSLQTQGNHTISAGSGKFMDVPNREVHFK